MNTLDKKINKNFFNKDFQAKFIPLSNDKIEKIY
jgi:hypothetical protein